MNTLMKKTLVASAFGLLLSANGAMAATSTAVAGGTISFTGSVTDTTCDVTTSGDKDFTVTLSPVALTDIDAAGVATAGAKQFDMKVSGCEGYEAGQSLHITFSGSNISDDEQYFKNDTGTATGVGIAITTDGSTEVALNSSAETGLGADVTAGTISYFANYYNFAGEGQATAGTVVTSATYTFDYQ